MTILKKTEFEKQIKEAIEKTTNLYATVTIEKQILDSPTSTIILKIEIPINGSIEDAHTITPS